MILPDKIEVGEKIINKYDFIENIYKMNTFRDLTRFCTFENVGNNSGIHRHYEMINDDPNKLTKINQYFDKKI